MAEYITKGTDTITMKFWMTDYNLMVQDRAAAAPQIDKVLGTETQPSDMKL